MTLGNRVKGVKSILLTFQESKSKVCTSLINQDLNISTRKLVVNVNMYVYLAYDTFIHGIHQMAQSN